MLKSFQSLINKHLNILYLDENAKEIFMPGSMVTFRSSRKLSSYLVRAKLYTYFRVKNPGGGGGGGSAQNLGLWRISARGRWMEVIYCLFVCLPFIYFKGAVCWVMHQLCGLALLDRRGDGVEVAISVEFWGGFGGLAPAYFVLLWV